MSALRFIHETNGFNARQRIAAEMLIAGVAFQEDGKTWIVISHYGDELGKMSTFMVFTTANMLKKAKLLINNSSHYKKNGHPSPPFPGAGVVTFGYNPSLVTKEEMEEMIERRSNNPQVLM